MFGQKSKPGAPSLETPGGAAGTQAMSFGPRAPAPPRVSEARRREGKDTQAPIEDVAETVPFEPRREEKQLIVGKGIVLKGEVSACDRLVVEGRVEASLKDSDIVVIADGGEFKGSAEINEADISGSFEGDLIVRKRLMVRSTGRITGEIRYGELEVERGGRISGDVQLGGATVAKAAVVE